MVTMKVILLLYLFAQVYAAVTIPEVRKNDTGLTVAKNELNKEYILEYFSKATWFNAHLSCLNCGMKLATINSEEEQNSVEKLITNYGILDEHFWTSGTDLAAEGRFSWFTNGNIFQYTNWGTGQPDNANRNEHCVHVRNFLRHNFTWNDFNCATEFYFICERSFEQNCPKC